jgi:hypothetical protein
MSYNAYDELREREWERLVSRYRSHGEYLLETKGADVNGSFWDRVWDAFNVGSPAPLLFEESRPDCALTLTEILDECSLEERRWLKMYPEHLGVRAEARLAGIAPEWFVLNGTLSIDDRARLGDLAMETLLEGLPVVG